MAKVELIDMQSESRLVGEFNATSPLRTGRLPGASARGFCPHLPGQPLHELFFAMPADCSHSAVKLCRQYPGSAVVPGFKCGEEPFNHANKSPFGFRFWSDHRRPAYRPRVPESLEACWAGERKQAERLRLKNIWFWAGKIEKIRLALSTACEGRF